MIDINGCAQIFLKISRILNEDDRILFYSSILFNDLMIET